MSTYRPPDGSVRHLTRMISSSLRNTQREKTPVSLPQRQKRQLRPAAPCLGPQAGPQLPDLSPGLPAEAAAPGDSTHSPSQQPARVEP